MLITDLNSRARAHRSAINAATARVLDRGWFVMGPEVSEFEGAFAQYCGVSNCISLANGTDALELALRAVGIQAGDRVATVANAGMYTATATLAIGAEPWFMDVDLTTRVVTADQVRTAVEAGVRAVVLTHLYGQAVPELEYIVGLCRAAGVAVIEDCAQAHGARHQGRRVGSFGDAGCFSFYPTKNLGALGDGGAVVSDRADVADAVKSLRQYGWRSKYCVARPGARNSRLDELQAACLMVFLPHLDAWNARRRDIARAYSAGIQHAHIEHPTVAGDDYVAHLYVVRCPARDSLRNHLKQHDIATDIHYPIPDHRQPVAGDRYQRIHLPNTERLAQEVLTLPCYPEMTNAQVDQVVKAVNGWAS
jgi:aminotransferase EvaB